MRYIHDFEGSGVTASNCDIACDEPNFVGQLKSEEINGRLYLTCAVSGYPMPYVIFRLRDRRLKADRRIGMFCGLLRVKSQEIKKGYSESDGTQTGGIRKTSVKRNLCCYRAIA
ncbi:unnamed protein product [Gongylonema pulchrum]|uniref:Ig-like domain-containing protein n=1 Tax=Gongylonema pulchrum TaxID=637853 RepID=A0A183DKY8_9BILA|nr:unnamed protein product [Gongylonema pulchrum]